MSVEYVITTQEILSDLEAAGGMLVLVWEEVSTVHCIYLINI